jgi:very-short-patch-repair endonuclease
MHPGRHLPYNSKLIGRAKELRANPTEAGRKLWDYFLKEFKPRIRRQRPIDNYIADFYCASARLVIEVDGQEHQNFEQKEYDVWRSKVLKSYDIEVLRQFDSVRSCILQKLASRSNLPPYKGGIEGGYENTVVIPNFSRTSITVALI